MANWRLLHWYGRCDKDAVDVGTGNWLKMAPDVNYQSQWAAGLFPEGLVSPTPGKTLQDSYIFRRVL
jgi:hypothetical protein